MAKRGHRTQVRDVKPLFVSGLSARSTRGVVRCGTAFFPCALGRGGRRALKREGDGATPIGSWRLRNVYYRSDRGLRPTTSLPLRAIRRHDGWCDAPTDRNYNRQVVHPYGASAERLWRDDHLYDVIAVLGYNDVPRQRYRGSAIFMHLARPGFAPTDGCIAVDRRAIMILLRGAARRTRIVVTG